MEKTRLNLLFNLILCLASCQIGQAENISTLPLVKNIPDEVFFATVVEEIKKARESITVVLSSFAYQEDNPDDPMVKTVQNLLLSHLEGLNVHLVLNRPYQLTFHKEGVRQLKNDPAFELLKAQGLPLTILSDTHTVFYNLIIIDNEIVIESSVPWVTGLEFNTTHFSSTLIRDPTLAEAKQKKIIKMGMADYRDKKKDRNLGSHIPLPNTLVRKKVIRAFIRSRYPLLQTYLVLVKEQLSSPKGKVTLQFKKIGRQVFDASVPDVDQVSRLTDMIHFLSDRLKLIKLYKIQGQITGYRARMPSEDTEDTLLVPLDFIKYGYTSLMKKDHLLLYFILLHEAQVKNTYPEWPFVENWEKNLPKVLRENAGPGLDELEKMRLMEPVRELASLQEGATPSFQFLRPQNPSMLKREFQILSQSYHPDHVRKAIFLAAQLNMEQQPEALRDLCYFLQELGLLETQKVLKQVSGFPRFHPNRNFGQVKLFLLQSLEAKIKRAGVPS